MKLDGRSIEALLKLKFRQVEYLGPTRALKVGYPLGYDGSAATAGHLIVMPPDCAASEFGDIGDSIALVTSKQITEEAHGAGYAAVGVYDNVPFETLRNDVQTLWHMFELWDCDLRAAIDTYAGFTVLLDSMVETMGCSCSLVDADYHTVLVSGPTARLRELRHPYGNRDGQELLREDTVDLLMASSEYRRLRTVRSVFAVPGAEHLFMSNIFAAGRLVGALVVEYPASTETDEALRFLQTHATRAAETMFSRMGSFGAAMLKSSPFRVLLKRAIQGELDDFASIDHVLLADGHSDLAQYVLLRIDRSFTHEGIEEYGHLARRLEQDAPGSYCVIANEAAYLLVDVVAFSQATGHDFWRDAPVILRELLLKAGASRLFTTMGQLAAARFQAAAALEQGNDVNPMYWCYRFDDYALEWIVSHGVEGVPSEYVAHASVVALKYFDSTHGTELLKSLAVYMRCRYNVTAAANELFVARSTLLNRLERIDAIAHINFDNILERIYVSLSLMLFKVE